MTDIITSQNIDTSSWNTLYYRQTSSPDLTLLVPSMSKTSSGLSCLETSLHLARKIKKITKECRMYNIA
jgi:hypothetical protein